MKLRVPVEVVAVLTDPVQVGKDPRGVHAPAPEVHIAPFVVNPKLIVHMFLELKCHGTFSGQSFKNTSLVKSSKLFEDVNNYSGQENLF